MASKDFYVEPKNESVNQKSASAGFFPEYRLCNADRLGDSERSGAAKGRRFGIFGDDSPVCDI